jgi:hypothetical protein
MMAELVLEEFIISPEYDAVYNLYDDSSDDKAEIIEAMEKLSIKLLSCIAKLK